MLIFSTCIGSRKYLQLSKSVLLGRGSAIIVIGLENQNFIGKLNLEYFFFEYILEFEPDIFNMTFQILNLWYFKGFLLNIPCQKILQHFRIGTQIMFAYQVLAYYL